MDGITVIVSSPEYWFGVTTALSLEDLARRALRARLGLAVPDDTEREDSDSGGN